MRIRSIKPQFWANESLADLPPHARLLFIALWQLADSAGRLEDRPRRIRAEVFPYEADVDVDALLQQLCAAGVLLRYEVNGVSLIQVVGFAKHQRISGKESETESIYPECSGEAMVKQSGSNREAPETTGREGKGREGNRKGKEGKGVPLATLARCTDAAGFAAAWAAYPHYERRGNRKLALTAWVKLKLEPLSENVMAWISALSCSDDWTRESGRYVPAMEVWLKRPDFRSVPDITPASVAKIGMSDREQKTMRNLTNWVNRKEAEEK